MPRSKNWLIAVMGTSPAVLTEFAWWNCHQRDRQIDRVEVWTTTAGRQVAHARLLGAHGAWHRLNQALKAANKPGLPPLDETRFRVFTNAGREIGDIRGAVEHHAMSQQLCARIKEIHDTEPNVILHALISGGRKSMSAMLQTAIELFGDADDRTYHVLVNPEIENSTEIGRFDFPTATYPAGHVFEPSKSNGARIPLSRDLPVEDQVVVVEQFVPHLKAAYPFLAQAKPEGHRVVFEPVIAKVALLLVDMVTSTPFLRKHGDQVFAEIVEKLLGLPLPGLRYRISTGDGFHAAFSSVVQARIAACILRRFLTRNELVRNHLARFRYILHYGEVIMGPTSNFIGLEVHRLHRIGAIRCHDNKQAAGPKPKVPFPKSGRIIITRPALDCLGEQERVVFELLGRFHLKGFDHAESEELWVEKTKRQRP